MKKKKSRADIGRFIGPTNDDENTLKKSLYVYQNDAHWRGAYMVHNNYFDPNSECPPEVPNRFRQPGQPKPPPDN
jgi:hypothetical protein